MAISFVRRVKLHMRADVDYIHLSHKYFWHNYLKAQWYSGEIMKHVRNCSYYISLKAAYQASQEAKATPIRESMKHQMMPYNGKSCYSPTFIWEKLRYYNKYRSVHVVSIPDDKPGMPCLNSNDGR